MALNIKNREVESLAAQVARLAGESKTEAIRRALEERKARLSVRPSGRPRRDRLELLLRQRIWPAVPAHRLGRRLSRHTVERILGYGRHGV